MNFVFSLGNGIDCRLFSHTGDIIHVFAHDARGIRTCTDAATSPSIAMYVVSTYYATETSSKKEDKDYGHHSTLPIGFICIIFFNFL